MSAMKKKRAPKGNSFTNLYWLVKENEFDLIDTMCACTNVQSYPFNNIEKGYNNYFCYPSNDHSVLKIREYIWIVIIIIIIEVLVFIIILKLLYDILYLPS